MKLTCPTGFKLLGNRAVLNEDDIGVLRTILSDYNDRIDRDEMTEDDVQQLYVPLRNMIDAIAQGCKS